MVEAEVLEALAQEPLSHVDPRFGAIFSEALSQTRRPGDFFSFPGSS
jgi:aspartate aminotransferase-like enzyme